MAIGHMATGVFAVNRIKVIVPIAMDEAGVANRAQQLPEGFVRPGFTPTFEAVRWGAALGARQKCSAPPNRKLLTPLPAAWRWNSARTENVCEVRYSRPAP